MASYEVVNNTSRYPYDYSVITDGDTITYTDTTESQYIIPPINPADANKYLQVNDTATGSRWNTVANELPSQTGVTGGSVLTTNGTTPSWSNDINLSKVKLAEGTRQSPSLVWNDPQDNTGFYGDGDNSIIYSANGNNQMKFTTGGILLYGSAGASIRGLSSNDTLVSNGSFGFIGQAPVMQQITSTPSQSSSRISVNTNNIEFLTSGSSVTPSVRMNIGTVNIGATVPINISHSGDAANPSLMFGDTSTGRSGLYSNPTNNTINISTDGVERIKIGVGEALLMNGTVLKGDSASSGSFSFANGTLPTVNRLNISDLGTATAPTLTFGDLGDTTGNTGPSGIYANPVDNTINFCTNSTERFKVDNGGVQAVGYCVASGPIVGSYLAPNTGGSVTGQGIRLKNDNYRNHQGIFCGATGTIGFSTTQSGDTGATASERVRINDSGLTVFGNIDVSGDVILGNKIRPQVGYLESNSATVNINLSDVIVNQVYIVNLTATGATGQTVDINNNLSITYSVHFTMYFYGTSTQVNTIGIIGNFGVGNHLYNSNFSVGASNVTTYTSTEPNSSQVDFTYYYNSNTPTDSIWIIRRIGPFN